MKPIDFEQELRKLKKDVSESDIKKLPGAFESLTAQQKALLKGGNGKVKVKVDDLYKKVEEEKKEEAKKDEPKKEEAKKVEEEKKVPSKEVEKKNEAKAPSQGGHESAKELLLKIKAECEKQKKSGIFKVSELGEDILG